VLELLDDGSLEIALVQLLGVGQVEEVEHVGVADRVHRALEGEPAGDQIEEACLVAALAQAGEELGVDLALEVDQAPARALRLDLVEESCVGLLHLGERAVVAPGERRGKAVGRRRSRAQDQRFLEFIQRGWMNRRPAPRRRDSPMADWWISGMRSAKAT
jgi:hypothetical protein